MAIGQNIILDTQKTEKIGDISVTGYVYPHVNREVLRQTLPYLTSLVIFTYGFTPEGHDEILSTDVGGNQ